MMDDKLEKIRKEIFGDNYIESSSKLKVLDPPKKLGMKGFGWLKCSDCLKVHKRKLKKYFNNTLNGSKEDKD